MIDDDTDGLGEEIQADEESTQPRESRRSGLVWVTIAAIILVCLVLFLLLRGCDSIQNSARRRSSTRQIVPVEAGHPVDGFVSVWAESGTDIQRTLSAAAVEFSAVEDMGGGRYIVKVTRGTEIAAARAIRGRPGIYDAGRVYEVSAGTP